MLFVIIIIVLILIIVGSNSSEQNNSKYSEKELDAFGLFDNEKEEVRKGNQFPWDFEEDPDEMEDDDYYAEDDE